jgi:sigma-B regulation protein RsbU (phosphoserine phosphatase)
VYGSAVAFEPGVFDGRARFAPYVCRTVGGEVLRAIDIGRDAYDYTQAAWYTQARQRGKAVWSEPYFDKGAGNALMVTRSAPIARDGKFVGVATADVELSGLQQRVQSGEEEEAEYVILGPGGVVVSHPDGSAVMAQRGTEIARRQHSAELEEIVSAMVRGESGVARSAWFGDTGPHWVGYAPVRATGWSLSVAVPDAAVRDSVYDQLWSSVGAMLFGLALILGVVWTMTVRLTQPIVRLAEGVEELRRGNLGVRVVEARGRDEMRQLTRGFNAMVQALANQVQELKEQTAAREEVEGELRVARQIQRSLLPSTFPPFPHRKEFELHAANVPARQVAGDFFDFFMVDDDVLTMIIADVSGKGVPAALLMAVTRTVVRNEASTGAGPGEIARRTEAVLNDAKGQKTMFVTVFLAQYRVSTGEVRYVNAGHPKPFRIRADGTVEEFGEITSPILGVELGELEGIVEKSETLWPGERLLMFTDGVPEARSPDGTFLGEELHNVVRHYRGDSVSRMCTDLVRHVQLFQGESVSDDVTLMALERCVQT